MKLPKRIGLLVQRLTFPCALLLLLSMAKNCPEKFKQGATNLYKEAAIGVKKIQKQLTPKETEYVKNGEYEKIVNEAGYPPGTVVEYYDMDGNRINCHPGSTPTTYTAPPPKRPKPTYTQPQSTKAANSLKFTPNSDESLRKAMAKLGGNPMAVSHASCFIKKNYGKKFKHGYGGKKSVKIGNKCKMIISDYTLPKSSLRMFVIDRCKGTIKRTAVAHGSGRHGIGKSQGKISEAPGGLGNKTGDKRTPRGFMVIGGYHTEGKKSNLWYPGIKLHGLQSFNNTNLGRGILLHKALYRDKNDGQIKDYARNEEKLITDSSGTRWRYPAGAFGHSYGCSAIPSENWSEMQTDFMGSKTNSSNGHVAAGPIMYNFGPMEKAKGANYCGDSEWLK